MKCKKCGVSLHPEQKVCINCGTQTDLWPGGVKKEEKPPLVIPWTPVAIIGGGLVLLIVLIVVGLSLKVVPADQVTKNWVQALVARDVNGAKRFTTEEFEASLVDRSLSAEKSDEYYQFMYDNKGGFTVSPAEPQPDGRTKVKISFNGATGQKMGAEVQLAKEGRQWKIVQVVP